MDGTVLPPSEWVMGIRDVGGRTQHQNPCAVSLPTWLYTGELL